MNEQEQREAIGKECSWTKTFPDEGGRLLLPYKWYNTKTGEYALELPDYLHDLNASFAMESTLFPVKVSELYEQDRWQVYRDWLARLCIGHPGGTARATAAQRAEAFLRTKKLSKY